MTIAKKIFTSDGYWTCPAGVTEVILEGCGGGGGAGGGRAYNGNDGLSGPGGGGAIIQVIRETVVPGTTYTITIGSGGAGGAGGITNPNHGSPGSIGLATYFGTIKFGPGNPGNGSQNSTYGGQGTWLGTISSGFSASQGGGGSSSPDNGIDAPFGSGSGGTKGISVGSYNVPPAYWGGGGGGGAGPYGNGANGGNGNGTGVGFPGDNATPNSGAGGGGGGSGDGAGGSGGNGGSGKLIIMWEE